MIEGIINSLTVEYLKNNEIGDKIQMAMIGVQKAQEAILAYVNDDSPEEQKYMRMGTVLAFAIVNKIAHGTPIKDFSNRDWEDIISSVANDAVMIEGQKYSIWVFSVYASYVDISVKVLEIRGISAKKCDAISMIAEEVRALGRKLESNQISEVKYTEQCIWLLIEAMIKLLASYSAIVVGENLADLNQSIAMLAFEYARYSLYKKEKVIVTQYLEHQNEVDEALEAKFDAFRNEMQDRCDIFDELIANAFAPDISIRLKSSIEIALNVGVEESEILDSTEKIDDYFM